MLVGKNMGVVKRLFSGSQWKPLEAKSFLLVSGFSKNKKHLFILTYKKKRID